MRLRCSVVLIVALPMVGCNGTPKGPPPVSANLSAKESLYAKYIKKPTGNNALEDYLKCMDQLEDPNIRQVWSEVQHAASNDAKGSKVQPVADWAEGQSLIDLRRIFRDRAEKSLSLIKSGNSKPIHFPETGSIRIKNVVEQACAVAAADFDDGRSAEATTILIDQLELCHQMGGSSLIGFLYTVVCDSIVLREMERHLDNLSADDCATIDTRVAALLAKDSALSIALPVEQRHQKETVRTLFREAMATKTRVEVKPGGYDGFSLGEQLRAMTPEQREKAVQDADKAIDDEFARRIKALTMPEMKWSWPTDVRPRPAGVTGTLTHFAFALDNVEFEAAARNRTQLRLLRLYAAVQAYRVKNSRLPASLEDLGRPDLLVNPLVAGGFHYGVSGKRYTVWSENRLGGRGPIELTGARKN